MEDKNAEELILSSRKHLFLANNLHSMYNYLKDRKKEGNNTDNNNSNDKASADKVSLADNVSHLL